MEKSALKLGRNRNCKEGDRNGIQGMEVEKYEDDIYPILTTQSMMRLPQKPSMPTTTRGGVPSSSASSSSPAITACFEIYWHAWIEVKSSIIIIGNTMNNTRVEDCRNRPEKSVESKDAKIKHTYSLI